MGRTRHTVLLLPIEHDALCLITTQTSASLSGAIRALIRDGLRYRAFSVNPDEIAREALRKIEGRNGERYPA